MSYVTVRGEAESEFVEKKSRFIGQVCPASSEEEALRFVEKIRARYPDATHNVWAYNLRQGRCRCSDDGEPSGTAGKPILNCILSRELQQVAVIVVRYFGGVKLGTGPLGKAYRTATQEALDNTEVIVRHHTLPLSFHVTYEDADKAERALKLVEAEDIQRTYGGESIRFDAQIISGRKTTLESALENFAKDFRVTETEK